MRVLPFDTLPAYRWQNGRGVSRRVASAPSGATLGGAGLLWQVSIADLAADGPFSDLPGLDRHFALLSGAATLRSNDPALEHAATVVTPSFAFQGDWPVECTVDQRPARALNVMTRRGRAGAQVTWVDVAGTTVLEKPVSETLVVVLVEGGIRATGSGQTVSLVGQGDAIVLDDAPYGQLTVSPGGLAKSAVLAARIALL